MKHKRMIDHVTALTKWLVLFLLAAAWCFLLVMILFSQSCAPAEVRPDPGLERQRLAQLHQARCRELHESMDIEDLRGYCQDLNIPGRRRQYICETVQEYDRECPSNATPATSQQ